MMIALLFDALQLTIVLALSNLLVRCLAWRSPQLAASICLIGITLATALIPLSLLPIPRFEFGDLQHAVATSIAMARPSDGLAKQLGESSGETPGNAANVISEGSGFDFQRLLSSLRESANPSVETQSSMLSLCMVVWFSLVGVWMQSFEIQVRLQVITIIMSREIKDRRCLFLRSFVWLRLYCCFLGQNDFG